MLNSDVGFVPSICIISAENQRKKKDDLTFLLSAERHISISIILMNPTMSIKLTGDDIRLLSKLYVRFTDIKKNNESLMSKT